METRIFCALLVSTSLMLGACGKKDEPKPSPAPAPVPSAETAPAPAPAGVAVSSLTAGSAIGTDKKVTVPTETFGKTDTMYVSVDTTGTGTAELAAKWTYRKGDQVAVVNEESMTVSATGPATHEFHVSKPDGWPAGEYQVEVMLNGQSAGSKKLTVR